jgi:hypothetical protein
MTVSSTVSSTRYYWHQIISPVVNLPSASASLISLARLLKLLGLIVVICVAVLLLLYGASVAGV